MREQENIPREGTPRGEKEPKAEISRRELLSKGLILGGAVLFAGGTYGMYVDGNKFVQANKDATRELQETLPDPEAIKTARQIGRESPWHILKYRTPQELWRAKETEAQQEKYIEKLATRVKEKLGKSPVLKMFDKGVAAAAGGGVTLGGAIRLMGERNKRVSAPAQNKQQ